MRFLAFITVLLICKHNNLIVTNSFRRLFRPEKNLLVKLASAYTDQAYVFGIFRGVCTRVEEGKEHLWPQVKFVNKVFLLAERFRSVF